MAELRPQSSIAACKLAGIRAATEESWSTITSDMNKIHNTFVKSSNNFKPQEKRDARQPEAPPRDPVTKSTGENQ